MRQAAWPLRYVSPRGAALGKQDARSHSKGAEKVSRYVWIRMIAALACVCGMLYVLLIVGPVRLAEYLAKM